MWAPACAAHWPWHTVLCLQRKPPTQGQSKLPPQSRVQMPSQTCFSKHRYSHCSHCSRSANAATRHPRLAVEKTTTRARNILHGAAALVSRTSSCACLISLALGRTTLEPRQAASRTAVATVAPVRAPSLPSVPSPGPSCVEWKPKECESCKHHTALLWSVMLWNVIHVLPRGACASSASDKLPGSEDCASSCHTSHVT